MTVVYSPVATATERLLKILNLSQPKMLKDNRCCILTRSSSYPLGVTNVKQNSVPGERNSRMLQGREPDTKEVR